jgi:hypothetical protein
MNVQRSAPPATRQPSARRAGARRLKIVDYMAAYCGVCGKAGAASGFNVAALESSAESADCIRLRGPDTASMWPRSIEHGNCKTYPSEAARFGSFNGAAL